MFGWFRKRTEDGEQAPKLRKIESFEVVTLHLSGMRFVKEYEIVCKGEEAEVSLYHISFSATDDRRQLDDRETLPTAEVIRLLNDCNLASWNGFHGAHPKGIKDGLMFTLTATINDGQTIRAEGSQNFPRKFDVLRDWFWNHTKG